MNGVHIVRRLQLLKHDWLYFDRAPAAECQRCKQVSWAIPLPEGPCLPKSDISEQLEILRRIAERGKKLAESSYRAIDRLDLDSDFIDIFVHILDEIKRTKNVYG